MTPAELKAKQSAGIQAREIETDIGGTRTLIELKCLNCDGVPENRVIKAGIGIADSAQVLTAATATRMLFDTVLYGESGFSDIAQERLIVPADGDYNFEFVANGALTASGSAATFEMKVEFRVNASSASPSSVVFHQIDPRSVWGFATGQVPFSLSASDFVEIFLTSGHDANITLDGQAVFAFDQITPALADIKPGLMYSVLEGGGPILHYCSKCDESEWINVKYPTLRWA